MKKEKRSQKRLNIPQKRRRAVHNLVIVLLALALVWVLLGMPAFTRQQAFNRAMRQNLLPETEVEIAFGNSAWGNVNIYLGEKDGRILQAAAQNKWLFWEVLGNYAAVTEPVNGVAIVPLVWDLKDTAGAPDILVRAEGVRGELTMELEGKVYPLIPDGKKDGWFLFRFDREIERNPGSRYDNYVEGRMYTHIDNIHSGAGTEGGTFRFTSYDESGAVAAQAERGF